MSTSTDQVADFAAELLEICEEAADLYQIHHRTDWWAQEHHAFRTEDFRACLAIHLGMEPAQVDLEACRRTLLTVGGVRLIEQDWYDRTRPARPG